MVFEQIKKQDEQYEALSKAEQLAKEGRVEEAIDIAEKVMYGESLLVKGNKWPFILSNLYLKNNMYDKCWKYLNFLVSHFPEMQDKINDIRAKILKEEGKDLDAMVTKMVAILHKYSSIDYKPTEEKIAKELNPYIKRAKLTEKNNDLLALMNKHLRSKVSNEGAFRNEIKSLIS